MQIFNDTLVLIFAFGQRWVAGITIFPFIFSKRMMKGNERHRNHEKIHIWQEGECLVIIYALIYFGHYGWNRLIKKMNHDTAYRNICFEKEAYANDDNLEYLKTRKLFSWIHYFK